MSEEEWLPENTDVSDSHSLVKTDLKILDENDLKNLASDIGIRYQPPKSRYQPPTRRPRRQHRKTKLYQPVEKIRDKRRTQYANSLPSKRKGSQLAIEEESQRLRWYKLKKTTSCFWQQICPKRSPAFGCLQRLVLEYCSKCWIFFTWMCVSIHSVGTPPESRFPDGDVTPNQIQEKYSLHVCTIPTTGGWIATTRLVSLPLKHPSSTVSTRLALLSFQSSTRFSTHLQQDRMACWITSQIMPTLLTSGARGRRTATRRLNGLMKCMSVWPKDVS